MGKQKIFLKHNGDISESNGNKVFHIRGYKMVWYRYLYMSEEIAHKKAIIKWKISHNAGQLDLYVITLTGGVKNLLDIIPSWELMQKHYPKKDLFIIGVSKGYEEAMGMAAAIVLEVYNQTQQFNVKEYFLKKHKKQSG